MQEKLLEHTMFLYIYKGFKMKYCRSIYQTKRWKTREVMVGNVGVGGRYPIRIQSMTTSSTKDVKETIEQIMRLADSGCDIARVMVQGKKEAQACEGIKNGLLQKGYTIPLVADIHFYPPAAMLVVEFVDKVRINPGNFVDRRATFQKVEYEEGSYKAEVEKIEEVFTPLIEKCIALKRAMRIGTNHGSLSDRIMSRYGDTPHGMVESALEFARICRKLNYHDFLFSMKASNPLVMIQAYRLLVAEMMQLGWNYPLHVGVTEAGEGEDGRVKSAVGIGSLLLDGLGDTIRVSLTEDPWHEIAPCKRLVAFAESYQGKGISPFVETKRNISEIKRRYVCVDQPFHPDGSVILFGKKKEEKSDAYFYEGKMYFEEKCVPIVPIEEVKSQAFAVYVKDGNPTIWSKLVTYPPKCILFEMTSSPLHQGRYFFEWIQQAQLSVPVILVASYSGGEEEVVIRSSAELGALLSDGLGEGVMLKMQNANYSLSLAILQACRMRFSKTEFISCPGCGRTLFDLQEVTKRIRSKLSHFPGLKIAIMGCIVNGPGEMADAHFGYVGAGRNTIDLYVGKRCVERGIHMLEADEKLIQLIKQHGYENEKAQKVKEGDVKATL